MNKTIAGIILLTLAGLQLYFAITMFNLKKKITDQDRELIEKKIKKIDQYSKTIQASVFTIVLFILFSGGFKCTAILLM